MILLPITLDVNRSMVIALRRDFSQTVMVMLIWRRNRRRVASCIVFILLLLGVLACSKHRSGYISIQSSNTFEATLFRQNCAICHGPEAEGRTLDDGRVIPNIRDGDHKYSTDQQIYEHITNGGNGMVPFRDILTERERNALVQFVQKELRGK